MDPDHAAGVTVKSEPESGDCELIEVKEEHDAQEPDTSADVDKLVTSIAKTNPGICTVKSESGLGAGGELYKDIDVSYTDVKEECAKISNDSQADSRASVNRKKGKLSKRSFVRRSSSSPECSYSTDHHRASLKTHALDHSNQHMSTHTGETSCVLNQPEKLISCNVCDYKCLLKCMLDQHMFTHTGEKLLSCNMCDYKCVRKYMLNRHMVTHTEEKSISCTECDYKCNSKKNFNQHMFTHTGKKPIVCSLCYYKCTSKSILKKHMLTHTGEKPFSCTKCDYKCISKKILNKHMFTHTKEKPISCTLCVYTCYTKYSFKRHTLTHPGALSCKRCDYMSTSTSMLKVHMSTHALKKSTATVFDYSRNPKTYKNNRVLNHTGNKSIKSPNSST